MIFKPVTRMGFIFAVVGISGAGMITSGCSTSPGVSRYPQSDPYSLSSNADQSLDEFLAAQEQGESAESNEPIEELEPIPVVVNEDVERWITYFTVKDRERFRDFLERGNQYREVVETILKDNGVPAQLFYLAMIESGFSTRATSRASAVGIWQFIRGTGRRYGLQINRYIDERRDPIRATEAAAKYLKDLYRVYNNWYLAMASYNAGEHRIVGAVMRGKTRDFWTLAEKGILPRETANYVPKFLAAVIIGSDPEKYGFQDLNEERYPNLEAVELPAPLRLRDIAKLTGISYSTLKSVNPHIRRGVTPPGEKTYEVWIPEGEAAAVKAKSTELASHRIKGLRNRSVASSRPYHRVRRGETLSSIARRYRMSVSYLKRINGLRSNRIMAGKRLRVSAKYYHPNRSGRYRVRRGDNLHDIARRFGMSVRSLKRMNGLRRNTIYVGQTLRVPSRDS